MDATAIITTTTNIFTLTSSPTDTLLNIKAISPESYSSSFLLPTSIPTTTTTTTATTTTNTSYSTCILDDGIEVAKSRIPHVPARYLAQRTFNVEIMSSKSVVEPPEPIFQESAFLRLFNGLRIICEHKPEFEEQNYKPLPPAFISCYTPFSFKQFLRCWMLLTNNNHPIFPFMLCLVDKLYDAGFFLDFNTLHHGVSVLLCLSSKYCDDHPRGNVFSANISGLELATFNKMELSLLNILKFNLNVTSDNFQRITIKLLSN